MIRNYLLVAWRVFKKNKLYNSVNILGLAVAIAMCLMITLYTEHELNYDTFLENADHIYSVYSKIKLRSDTIEFPLMNYSAGSIIANEDPSVESYIRIQHPYKDLVTQNPALPNMIFNESAFLFADNNFFNFFSFPLKYGNPSFVLQKPFSIVLTENTAKKYFGNVNPVGKTIQIDSVYIFEITGVANNPPSNSIFHFDFIASMASKFSMTGANLISSKNGISYGDFQTFFLLRNPINANLFQSNIRRLAQIYSSDQEIGSLQYVIPMLDMHLHIKFGNTSNIKYLEIFPIAAVLILLLAIINYVCVSSAKSILRSKEIGMRKVTGAGRLKIAKQFYIESSVYIVTAFFIGLIIFFVTKSYFFNLLQFKIDKSFAWNPFVLITFGSILLFTILISGSYPAFVLSSYKPAVVLYNRQQRPRTGTAIRKIFILIQFTIAIAIIIYSVVISQQLYFIRHSNTNISRDNVLMIPFRTTIHNNYSAFKNDIKHLAGVQSVATARDPMYKKFQVLTATQKKTNKDVSLAVLTGDKYFLNLLHIPWLIAPDIANLESGNCVIINESAIEELNLSGNPIGNEIEINGEQFQINGVLKNFSYKSLNSKIEGLGILVKADTAINWGSQVGGCLFVKTFPNADFPSLINSIKNIYDKYDKSTPFDYDFMDHAFNAQYKAEERLSHIISIFSVIAIVTALLGIIGLASFSAQQRIKEIGIRKAIGASTQSIIYLLNQDFFMPVLIAIALAIPIAWYYTHEWLNDFAYRVPLSIWVFIFSSLATIILTILTATLISIKSALVNPAKNLRTE